MNILTLLDIHALLLIAILIVQLLIWLRLPKRDDPYKRRQRRRRINRVKSFIFRKDYE